MPVYQQLLHDPIVHWLLGLSVLVLLLDLVTGIMASLHLHTFQWKRIGDILPRGVFSYLLILSMSFFGTLLQGYLLAALILSIGTTLQNLIVLLSVVNNIGEWSMTPEMIPDPLWIAQQQTMGEVPPWIARLDLPSLSGIPTQPNLPHVRGKR
jgi:ABC-type multidrug transport system fused ATPase/permease subunit